MRFAEIQTSACETSGEVVLIVTMNTKVKTKMIETIEKFPNLRVIDSVIDEIKDLIDYDENPIQFWIAGGAVTAAITGAKINDYDIFLLN